MDRFKSIVVIVHPFLPVTFTVNSRDDLSSMITYATINGNYVSIAYISNDKGLNIMGVVCEIEVVAVSRYR